jgi:EAL domain-containing protein (putative c-di-GMP-specific phosphodiesterase class I)
MALGEEAVTVARMDGNEFAVVLPAVRIERATQIVHKLEEIMEMPFSIQDTPIHIEIRAGIALYPDHADEPTELIKRADVALRLAEEAKSNFTVYDTDRDPFSLRRLTLFGELRQAISQNGLMLHYQPKVEMKTNNVIAVEALARWPHPEEGMIPPGEFIPLAEHTGLIGPLTLWVFNTAARQCQAWDQADMPIRTAVNLSARNLQDPDLPEWLSGCMRSFGVSPDRLILEITESAIMFNPERALDVLKRLKAMGLSLSIDDYGTGYSSLAYLRKLPVDEIKIDQSFISAMTKNENDKVIVRSTIDLAHNLGLKVVAEGVEDKATWEQLADLGCDIAQGYYISHPLSAADLTSWLRKPPPMWENGRGKPIP